MVLCGSYLRGTYKLLFVTMQVAESFTKFYSEYPSIAIHISVSAYCPYFVFIRLPLFIAQSFICAFLSLHLRLLFASIRRRLPYDILRYTSNPPALSGTGFVMVIRELYLIKSFTMSIPGLFRSSKSTVKAFVAQSLHKSYCFLILNLCITCFHQLNAVPTTCPVVDAISPLSHATVSPAMHVMHYLPCACPVVQGCVFSYYIRFCSNHRR